MRIFSKLRAIAETHREAEARNRKALAEAEVAAEEIQRETQVTEALLAITKAQAESLQGHNDRNHYSESLTFSIRGRMA